MTKLRRKTVAPKRKAAMKRAVGATKSSAPIHWFYRPVNLPYRVSPEVEKKIEDAVNQL